MNLLYFIYSVFPFEITLNWIRRFRNMQFSLDVSVINNNLKISLKIMFHWFFLISHGCLILNKNFEMKFLFKMKWKKSKKIMKAASLSEIKNDFSNKKKVRSCSMVALLFFFFYSMKWNPIKEYSIPPLINHSSHFPRRVFCFNFLMFITRSTTHSSDSPSYSGP